MLSMSMQLQTQMSTLKKSGLLSAGLGQRSNLDKGSTVDRMILTRKLNLPELIFNQDSRQDRNVKKRFFEIDHGHKWTMADNHNHHQKKDVCYVCQKQKYSLIFYERDPHGSCKISSASKNKELIPIEDAEFLAHLKSEYRLKYSQDLKTRKAMWAPLICGTVVTGQHDLAGTHK